MLKVLDLFSGIGGFSLGLERAGMETVAFCEIEPYPQAVLRKNFPGVPIYEDVRTVTADRLRADGIDRVDLVCGGFPCQPFSVAGKQQGKDDHRHLWPEMLRIVQEFNPTWVIGENVSGFVEMALDDVCADLENAGYEVQSFIVPACAVDAPHRRDRCWIVAYSRRKGLYQRWQFANAERENHRPAGMGGDGVSQGSVSQSETVADTNGAGCEEQHTACLAARQGQHTGGIAEGWSHWPTEPAVGRVANGIPRRMDRLKCLGNTVVPQIPEMIGRAILATMNE